MIYKVRSGKKFANEILLVFKIIFFLLLKVLWLNRNVCKNIGKSLFIISTGNLNLHFSSGNIFQLMYQEICYSINMEDFMSSLEYRFENKVDVSFQKTIADFPNKK